MLNKNKIVADICFTMKKIRSNEIQLKLYILKVVFEKFIRINKKKIKIKNLLQYFN